MKLNTLMHEAIFHKKAQLTLSILKLPDGRMTIFESSLYVNMIKSKSSPTIARTNEPAHLFRPTFEAQYPSRHPPCAHDIQVQSRMIISYAPHFRNACATSLLLRERIS